MKTTPTVFFIVTLGIVQFISFFVYYSIVRSPDLLLHIIAISNLGIWALFVWVLPRYLERTDKAPPIPDRVYDLMNKSWNEGLTAPEREELRLWIEEEESKE